MYNQILATVFDRKWFGTPLPLSARVIECSSQNTLDFLSAVPDENARFVDSPMLQFMRILPSFADLQQYLESVPEEQRVVVEASEVFDFMRHNQVEVSEATISPAHIVEALCEFPEVLGNVFVDSRNSSLNVIDASHALMWRYSPTIEFTPVLLTAALEFAKFATVGESAHLLSRLPKYLPVAGQLYFATWMNRENAELMRSIARDEWISYAVALVSQQLPQRPQFDEVVASTREYVASGLSFDKFVPYMRSELSAKRAVLGAQSGLPVDIAIALSVDD